VIHLVCGEEGSSGSLEDPILYTALVSLFSPLGHCPFPGVKWGLNPFSRSFWFPTWQNLGALSFL
jgi:hypothetical protein